jgi:PAS domain S-box-containing protein/putative nucleotidyltransferase with HDIG domain
MRDGRILEANQAYRQLLGIGSRNEMLRLNAAEFYWDTADRSRMQAELERAGYAQNFDIVMRTLDGRRLETVHTISLRRAADGTILGYQGIIRDETEKRRMEAALREAERNQIIVSITGLVSSLEARDAYTRGHSESVANIILGIAGMVGASQPEIEMAVVGGRLHDIGKIGVRDSVLLKPGSLTDEEFGQIKQHTTIGPRILDSIPGLQPEVIDIVRSHHERFDGKGYPHGLRGKNIPRWARITAVADTYDALTSDWPYRRQLSREKAFEIIRSVRGTQLCPESVDLFFRWAETQPVRQLT